MKTAWTSSGIAIRLRPFLRMVNGVCMASTHDLLPAPPPGRGDDRPDPLKGPGLRLPARALRFDGPGAAGPAIRRSSGRDDRRRGPAPGPAAGWRVAGATPGAWSPPGRRRPPGVS